MDDHATHYISDNVYELGTLACAVCGQHFPTDTSATRSHACAQCGTLHKPGTFSALTQARRSGAARQGSAVGMTSSNSGGSRYATTAALFFTSEEVEAAHTHVENTLMKSSTNYAAEYCALGSSSGAVSDVLRRRVGARRAGTTEVDNRVIEQAFCEQCGKHQPCKSFARQTRSADEGQTIFYQCTVCSSEWQQNS